MSNSSEVITLDVRGEVCPGPLIKVTEAMRSASQGQQIELLTDFQPAVLTVTSAAVKEGWDISVQRLGPSEWRLLLTRSKAAVA